MVWTGQYAWYLMRNELDVFNVHGSLFTDHVQYACAMWDFQFIVTIIKIIIGRIFTFFSRLSTENVTLSIPTIEKLITISQSSLISERRRIKITYHGAFYAVYLFFKTRVDESNAKMVLVAVTAVTQLSQTEYFIACMCALCIRICEQCTVYTVHCTLRMKFILVHSIHQCYQHCGPLQIKC